MLLVLRAHSRAPEKNPHGAQEFHRATNGQPGPPPTSSLPIPLPQIPLPNSALLAAATSRAAIQITPVPPRPERAPRDHRVGILRCSAPPSLSASLPISAVYHFAPPRSERFQKTPQRSEGTQRGKGRMGARRALPTEAVRVLPPPLPPPALRVGCGLAALCPTQLCGHRGVSDW